MFFSFFENFQFQGRGHNISSKRGYNFGAGWRLKKWSDLAEILHTWSLGESLGVFFSFFQNFHLKGRGHDFSPTRGWEAGDFKNDRIWLKFSTLGPWVNPWVFLLFFQNFHL